MTEAWKQWEDHIVDGVFPLRQCLGGGERSAVFLTEFGEPEPAKAAIKLVVADAGETEWQLSLWERASELSHPCLLRLLRSGRQPTDPPLLYVVMEFAEENLSQVLEQRALTVGEARDLLEQVLDALAYLHAKGFVHGHLKPANILAAGDRLKLSTDRLCPAGEPRRAAAEPDIHDAPEIGSGPATPAADIWSLGVTLAEILAQRNPVWREGQEEPDLPGSLPAPFLGIVRRCLRRDPAQRCTIADIREALHPAAAASPKTRDVRPSQQARTPAPARRSYVGPVLAAALVLVAIVVGTGLISRRGPEPPKQAATAPAQQSKPRPEPSSANASAGGAVVRRVLPDVPSRARHTIRGRVRVNVRVHVDGTGNVAGAKLESSPSRYFGRLALQSVRDWKFAPATEDGQPVESDWLLRFEFRPTHTSVFPVRVSR